MQGCTTKQNTYELPSRYSQTLLGIERNVIGTNTDAYSFCDMNRSGFLYGCAITTAKTLDDTQPIDFKKLLSGEPYAVVNFNFDSYTLTQEAVDKLSLIDISELENKTIVLKGYTDSIGENLYNERLAKNRALAVSEYFNKFLGLPNNVQTLGFGLCCYVVPNTTEANREINRRVEIYLD